MDRSEWVRVPRVPTLAMAEAGADVDPERESVWAAMLAAAPPPPAEQASGELPEPKKYPQPDENGNDTGPCCAHAYVDGWNGCLKEVLAAAPTPRTQPVVNVSELAGARTRLKSGEYDGVDIMRAWLAIDALIALSQRPVVDEAMTRWSQIAAEGTPSDWQAEQADLRRYFAALAPQQPTGEEG